MEKAPLEAVTFAIQFDNRHLPSCLSIVKLDGNSSFEMATDGNVAIWMTSYVADLGVVRPIGSVGQIPAVDCQRSDRQFAIPAAPPPPLSIVKVDVIWSFEMSPDVADDTSMMKALAALRIAPRGGGCGGATL